MIGDHSSCNIMKKISVRFLDHALAAPAVPRIFSGGKFLSLNHGRHAERCDRMCWLLLGERAEKFLKCTLIYSSNDLIFQEIHLSNSLFSSHLKCIAILNFFWKARFFLSWHFLIFQAASPACAELEMVVVDWLARMMNMPEHFMHDSGKGGGVLQVSFRENGVLKFYKIISWLEPLSSDFRIKLRLDNRESRVHPKNALWFQLSIFLMKQRHTSDRS